MITNRMNHNIIDEIPWLQFVKRNEIRILPLLEQVSKYNQYLLIQQQSMGAYVVPSPETNFLMSEDGTALLQQNKSNILIN